MFSDIKKKDPLQSYKDELCAIIKDVDNLLVCNQRSFDYCADDNITEVLIYERKALMARRKHLLALYNAADSANLEDVTKSLLSQLLTA